MSVILLFTWSSLETSAKPLTDKSDSLLRLIHTQNNEPDKVENLISFAGQIYKSYPDSAMLFCEKAYALSEDINYPNGQSDALYMMILIAKYKGDREAVLSFIKSYLDLDATIKDSSRLAKGFYQFGLFLRSESKPGSSLYYYKKALQIFEYQKDTTRMIITINSIGNVFQYNAKLDSSALYFQEALELCEETGNEKYAGTIYSNLGESYFMLKDYNSAKKYLKLSCVIDEIYGKRKNLAITLTKLGNVANEEWNLDSALYYYKMAEPLFREVKDHRGINDLYICYGSVFLKLKLYDLAYKNFNLALSYYKTQNIPEGIIVAWQNIADYYRELGKDDQRLLMLDSCLTLSLESDLDQKTLHILKLMYESYVDIEDYKKAISYYHQYDSLKELIYSLDKEAFIADLRIQYERDLDQARIVKLKNEKLTLRNENLRKTKQRNIYFFTGLSIIALGLFFILYLRLIARKNRIISEQRILQLEEEKKLLAARFLVEGQEEERKRIATELHDGLGVLLSATKLQFTSIKDVKPENKPLIDKATQFLEQATSDVRKISHNMMPGLLTKLGLCEALEDLFEKLEETEGMDAVCEITGARERLPQNQEIMIYRIVQEMVNNTLKHAGAKKIALMVNVLPSKLDILFSDNGKGFDVDKMLEKKSMGLQSIISRVKFLNGTVSINSSPGKGTEFAMQIPVTTEQ